MTLKWDAELRRWRLNNRIVPLSKQVGLRNELADLYSSYLRHEANLFVSGKLEFANWVANSEKYILDATGNGYSFGRGGTLNLTNSDYDRLARTLNKQVELFRGFADEVKAGNLSPLQVAARAESYGGSVVYAHEQAVNQAAIGDDPNADWELPFYPGDGDTNCLSRCFPSDIVVDHAGLSGAYSRWFDGEVVTIETASGNKLTATPNHPVLTTRGWIPIGEITQADHLVSASIRDEVRSRDPHVQNMPTKIGDVFHSARNAWHSQRTMGSELDFHGDGSNREVDIVLRRGNLTVKRNPAILEHGRELILTGANSLRKVSLLADSMQREFFGRLLADTRSCVSCGGQSLSLVGAGVGHADVHRFASVSRSNSATKQTSNNRSTVNAIRLRESKYALSSGESSNNLVNRNLRVGAWSGIPKIDSAFFDSISDRSPVNGKSLGDAIHRLARDVAFDDVIVVSRQSFHGNVYNLQTDSEWYIASGVIVHNCRCAWEIDEDEYAWTCTYHTMGDDQMCEDCIARGRQYGEGSPLVFPKANAPMQIRDLGAA